VLINDFKDVSTVYRSLMQPESQLLRIQALR